MQDCVNDRIQPDQGDKGNDSRGQSYWYLMDRVEVTQTGRAVSKIGNLSFHMAQRHVRAGFTA